MVAATTTELLSLLRAINMPSIGAGPPIVTVPMDVVPPMTFVGLTLTDTNGGGAIVSVTVCPIPGVAVMWATT